MRGGTHGRCPSLHEREPPGEPRSCPAHARARSRRPARARDGRVLGRGARGGGAGGARGRTVALAARRQRTARGERGGAPRRGPCALALACDVTRGEDCRRCVERSRSRRSAASTRWSTPRGSRRSVCSAEAGQADWRAVLDVNLIGASLVTAAALERAAREPRPRALRRLLQRTPDAARHRPLQRLEERALRPDRGLAHGAPGGGLHQGGARQHHRHRVRAAWGPERTRRSPSSGSSAACSRRRR